MRFVAYCGLCEAFFPLPTPGCGCPLCAERSICPRCDRFLGIRDKRQITCGLCTPCREGAVSEILPTDDPSDVEHLVRRLGLPPDVPLWPRTVALGESKDEEHRDRGALMHRLYALPETLPSVLAGAPREWAEPPFPLAEKHRRLLQEGRITRTGTPTAMLVPGGLSTTPGSPRRSAELTPPSRWIGDLLNHWEPIFLLRLRAWFRGQPGYYETYYDPVLGQRTRVENADPDRARDVIALLDLVRERARPGRRLWSGRFASEDECRLALATVVITMREAGLRTTVENVAEFFEREPFKIETSARQVRRWVRMLGYESWGLFLGTIGVR